MKLFFALPRRAWLYALAVMLFVLFLFYHWFAVADRYAIFLYGHLTATPFDSTTRSRYWMAGLVAAGMLFGVYVLLHWLVALVTVRHPLRLAPPRWWQVWSLCALPTAAGIVYITTQFNWPTLPVSLALTCAVITLAGLALALAAATWFVQHPGNALWLAWISVGLVAVLVLVRVVELPARGIVEASLAYGVATGSVIFGVLWTMLWLHLYARRDKQVPPVWHLLLASMTCAYLILPVVHHWLFTPAAFRYISTATNFFAQLPGIQLLTFGAALLVATVSYLVRRGPRLIGRAQVDTRRA